MIEEQVNEDGYTVDEIVKIIPNDLSADGISFASVVSEIKDQYELPLDKVIHYVRLGIYELYDHGARPVGMAPKEIPYDWVLLPQYGKSKEEIADNVIQEWKNNNYNDPDYDKLWFALVDEYCYVPEEYGELIAVKASSHI